MARVKKAWLPPAWEAERSRLGEATDAEGPELDRASTEPGTFQFPCGASKKKKRKIPPSKRRTSGNGGSRILRIGTFVSFYLGTISSSFPLLSVRKRSHPFEGINTPSERSGTGRGHPRRRSSFSATSIPRRSDPFRTIHRMAKKEEEPPDVPPTPPMLSPFSPPPEEGFERESFPGSTHRNPSDPIRDGLG